ncbi:MAG TPA: 30S ribosomal protein S7 [Bdellovibrionota bacterium]|nr:30S ribosomal protein S7 [Bdellovibrionota bacterium]
MPRRREIATRVREADPKFHDRLVSRFVTTIMRSGKKSVAEHLVYGSFDILAEKMKDDPLRIFKRAIDNIKPVVETKSRRVGGATYQVPMEVRTTRREALGLRWLILAAKSRPGHSMREKLADEVMDAYNNRGAAIKKREDVHKMAEANKAFAHYRW